MSSHFNYSFALWLRKFSSLGNLNVSESALKHKHMEKKLGSVRGRQATIDALIDNSMNTILSGASINMSVITQSSVNQVMTNLSDR